MAPGFDIGAAIDRSGECDQCAARTDGGSRRIAAAVNDRDAAGTDEGAARGAAAVDVELIAAVEPEIQQNIAGEHAVIGHDKSFVAPVCEGAGMKSDRMIVTGKMPGAVGQMQLRSADGNENAAPRQSK